MKQYWQQMSERERRMVSAMVLVVAATLYYLLIWEPITSRSAMLEQRITAQSETLAWMQHASQQIRAQGRSATSRRADNLSLISSINQAVNQHGLSKEIERIQPDGSSRVRVWFREVSFQQLVRWLHSVQNSSGARVAMLVVDAGDEGGRVSARIELERI